VAWFCDAAALPVAPVEFNVKNNTQSEAATSKTDPDKMASAVL